MVRRRSRRSAQEEGSWIVKGRLLLWKSFGRQERQQEKYGAFDSTIQIQLRNELGERGPRSDPPSQA